MGGDSAGAVAASKETVQRALLGDPAALVVLLRKHKESLRRIVSIRLTARLARVLDEEGLPDDALRTSLLAAHEGDVVSEAGLVRWMARMVEREVRRRGDGASVEAREPSRSMRFDGGADASESSRARRESSARLVDALVAELEPEELREVLLLRDYCAADWELVRGRLGLASVEAAQALYRRAHERLARHMRSHLRKQV